MRTFHYVNIPQRCSLNVWVQYICAGRRSRVSKFCCKYFFQQNLTNQGNISHRVAFTFCLILKWQWILIYVVPIAKLETLLRSREVEGEKWWYPFRRRKSGNKQHHFAALELTFLKLLGRRKEKKKKKRPTISCYGTLGNRSHSGRN